MKRCFLLILVICLALTALVPFEAAAVADAVGAESKAAPTSAAASGASGAMLLRKARYAKVPALIGTEGEPKRRLPVETVAVETVVREPDTTPPAAVAVPVSGYVGQSYAAASFVRDIADESPTSVRFAGRPDFLALGTQDVTVVVADTSGNELRLQSTLSLTRNPAGPAIQGVRNFSVTTAAAPDYLAGVSAHDPIDGSVPVSVDSSAVNLDVNGSYPIVYKASDSAGHTASRTAYVTVQKITPYAPRGDAGTASLNQLADGILSQLINNDMSSFQIMSTIYYWTRSQISYSSPASSVYTTGAEAGLRYRRGNCYTMTYTMVALMRRAGIWAGWNTEYQGRHCWAVVSDGVNNRIIDATVGIFWLTEASQQDRVWGGYYLYRTTESPPPPSWLVFRTEYDNYQTVPFQTVYEIDPNEASLYPTQTPDPARPGQDGQTRDQWNRAYVNGQRNPAEDYMIEQAQIVTAVEHRVIWIGQLETVSVTPIEAPNLGQTVVTADPALNGTVVPGTGLAGSSTLQRRVVAVDPATGAATFGDPVEIRVEPTPIQTYVYVAPETSSPETSAPSETPDTSAPSETTVTPDTTPTPVPADPANP